MKLGELRNLRIDGKALEATVESASQTIVGAVDVGRAGRAVGGESRRPRIGARGVMFKIITNATKYGTYEIRIFRPSVTQINPSSSAALVDADFGDLPDANDGYAINMAEKGTNTHDLSTGDVFVGFLHPLPASDGKPVVIFRSFSTENCS